MDAKKINARTFSGTVVSNAMQKTITVRVDAKKLHEKYQKYYRVSKKYHVHDETNQYTVGQKVRFQECRPYSKTKRWRVLAQK